MSTSAILTAPGSAARTRTPMACCASTFQREPISACMMPMSLRPSRSPSMRDPARPLAGKRPPRLWTNSSEPSIQRSRQRVLRRPLESAQYACKDYATVLADHHIKASMSRVGNPYDNAKAERFMKTLKHEEVHASGYRDIADARTRIGSFIEQVYNRQRLHSALDYRPPAEYEENLARLGGAGPPPPPRTPTPPPPRLFGPPRQEKEKLRRGGGGAPPPHKAEPATC